MPALVHFEKPATQINNSRHKQAVSSLRRRLFHFSVSAGSVPEPGGGLADLQLGAGRRWEVHLHRGRTGPEHV